MSTLNVNNIAPESGTTITIGGSGDKVTLGGGGLGIVGVSTFTSSGTWTKATRESALGVTIKRVIVEVQGAGGSGGVINGSYAGPGAAGGYAKKLIDVSSISSSTITIGSGGAGVTSGNGNNGGSSIWSDGTNTITCGGGSGGDGTTNYLSRVGGAATGGDINIPGQDSNYIRGSGAASVLGHGGPDSDSSSSFTGGSSPNARGYGAGGAPSYTSTSGNGGDGIVIVTEIAG
jgi:hypothetical protein